MEDNLFDTYTELVEETLDLSNELSADLSHGSFDTKQDRDEFITYFNDRFKNVNNKFEIMKIKLKLSK